MPKATIGNKTSLDLKGNFLELKGKGEKITIRILNQDYYFEGKHFQQREDNSWNISSCPRINQELHCIICEKWFETTEPIKDLKKQQKATEDEQEKATYQVQIDAINKQARPYKPTISFYYPVLDRTDGKAKIFKTVLSIRLALEEFAEMGQDVLDTDYVVMRTEKPGSGYYSIMPIDSKKTKEITPEEEAEIAKGSSWDMEQIITGGRKSELSFEEDTEEAIEVDEAEQVSENE